MNFKKYFVVLIFFISSCHSYFYYPSKRQFSAPDQMGLIYEEVGFSSKDGSRLTGWFIPAFDTTSEPLGTVIQFHGNADNMTSHWFSLAWMAFQGYNLFTFDYRGYGHSEGIPDVDGTVQDGIAAIEYVRQRKDIDPSNLILVGQSLGGAIAIAAFPYGASSGIRAVVIESAFSSYTKIAKDKINDSWFFWHLQWLTPLFIDDDYSPDKYVHNISPVPVLFIHGTHDRVIPYHHSENLYEKAQDPKYLWKVEGGEHIQAFNFFKYRIKLLKFLEDQRSLKS